MTTKDLAKKIGHLLRVARAGAGLTQTELAQKTGIPATNLSRLERGSHLPNVLTLYRVCVVLDVSVRVLLPEESPAAPAPAQPKGHA
jgi:transcriptional regulator with XRE-family HTH domain